MAEYEAVVEIDWRAEFTRQSAVDLNSANATLVDEMGATWRVPSTAAGDPGDQNNGSTSWGLTSNGLEVVDCVNAGLSPTVNPVTPMLMIQLADLAAAWGFDPDPMRQYLIQTYISIQENADDDQDHSGIATWKSSGRPVGSTQWMNQIGVGFYLALGAVGNRVAKINAAGVQTEVRSGLGGLDVVGVQYGFHGKNLGHYAADFSSGWPDQGDLRYIGTASEEDTTQIDSSVIGDPAEGFLIGLFHQANATTQTYRAVHQQTRILQL